MTKNSPSDTLSRLGLKRGEKMEKKKVIEPTLKGYTYIELGANIYTKCKLCDKVAKKMFYNTEMTKDGGVKTNVICLECSKA